MVQSIKCNSRGMGMVKRTHKNSIESSLEKLGEILRGSKLWSGFWRTLGISWVKKNWWQGMRWCKSVSKTQREKNAILRRFSVASYSQHTGRTWGNWWRWDWRVKNSSWKTLSWSYDVSLFMWGSPGSCVLSQVNFNSFSSHSPKVMYFMVGWNVAWLPTASQC